MKRNSLLICLFAVLFLSSCGGRSKTASALANGDTIPLRYAENLTLMSYPGYTLATLRNPWDTLHTLHTYILVPKDRELPAHLPAGTVVRTPLSKSVIYSSVHCGLMDNLGVFGSIGGVCDLKYIKLPAVHEACRRGAIADCGDGMNPDMERIIDLHPDAILLSPFENSGGYGKLDNLNIPIIETADYMETSPLGRAEWIKFYGLLYGADKADSLFAAIEKGYLSLKAQAAKLPKGLSVITERKMGSVWYSPGGKSTMGILLKDANARYIFADDEHSGSLSLSPEQVIARGREVDVWAFKYFGGQPLSRAALLQEYDGYKALRAFQTGNIYECNTDRIPYFETVSFHPEILLREFILLSHPQAKGLGALRFYRKM